MNKTIDVQYAQKSNMDMQKCMNKRVRQYFKEKGISTKANVNMWVRVFFFLGLYAFSWWHLVSSTHTIFLTGLYFLLFILTFKGIAYNVVHDACHRSISGNKNIDEFIYWVSLSLLGPDPYLWKARHNIDHHHYVNVPGLDSQLEGAIVFRFSPHQVWEPIHRYQHLYASLVYSIVTLHWIFVRDFQDIFSKKFKDIHSKKSFYFHLTRMIFTKTLYILFMVIIPTILLPYSFLAIFLSFIVFHLVMSWLVTLTFAVSHINKDLYFVNHDDEGKINHSFMEHQLKTAVDYSTNNKIVNFIFGGMNCHVAHHIYPSISSAHLPAVTRIISQTAKEYGVSYHSRSLLDLVKSHFMFLRDMGSSEKSGQCILIKAGENNA